MPDSALYGLLGLEPTASPRSIKCAYRTLAKRLHPDKSQDPDATEVFQKLNNAYQILCDSNYSSLLSREDKCNDVESSHSALPNISIVTRENTFSVTIDITDIMFLAFLEECQQHHCVSPVDRGHNGIQLRFEYASPDDANEHFGTISLTFYATTSRLLVQGTSYLLWIDEHLPIIYKKAEQTYEENIGKWRSLARRRGIGVKRVTHQAREGRGHIIPTDPKSDQTGLSTSPHSPNTHPPASDKVSPSSAACPHAVCVSLSAASVSHESHSHPIPGGDRCSVPSLSPSLPILGTLHQDDPSPCGPSHDDLSRVNPSLGDPQEVSSQGAFPQDDPPREAVAQSDSPVTRSKRKLPESGELSGEKTVKKTESKRPKKKVKKDVKPKVTGKKTPSPSQAKYPPGQYCSPSCSLNNTANSDMIRCSLCMWWFHTACSGEDSKYIGVFTCSACRKLPSLVMDLVSQVSDLKNYIQDLKDHDLSMKVELQRLKSENGNLKQKVVNLENVNGDLQKLIETMSDCDTVPNKPDLSTPYPCVVDNGCVPMVSTSNRFAALVEGERAAVGPATVTTANTARHREPLQRTTPKPVTVNVIGSSIVRGVAPLVQGQGFEATGYVFPGRTARQINGSLRNIPVSDITVLAAGSNNIAGQPVAQCKEEIRQVIDNLSRKRVNQTVIMAEIPLRHDTPALNSKIMDVNQFIASEVAKRKSWYLLSHDFDKSDYRPDGLHLNRLGCAKYAHEIRHIVRCVRKR